MLHMLPFSVQMIFYIHIFHWAVVPDRSIDVKDLRGFMSPALKLPSAYYIER